MIGFLFLIGLLGPFAIVMLRKVLVIDYKLAFPGGTATALMINSLHGEKEADVTGKKVRCLVKYMSLSFAWSFLSGSLVVLVTHGFDNFPTFGVAALRTRFISTLIPVMLDNLSSSDFRGLYGYKVFVAISIILGDGLYNLVKIFVVIARGICIGQLRKGDQPVQALQDNKNSRQLVDDELQTEMFFKDKIPTWFAVSGYIVLAAVSTATVPTIFPQLKWHLVLVCYLLAPAIAFCNSYGMGLTNLNLAPTYGKIALFIFASLVGSSDGGVIAGLAASGIIMSIACSAADLMQDFKCGYLTLSSPRSMFISQLTGAVLGCIIVPPHCGSSGRPSISVILMVSTSPFAIIFREMAILGVKGVAALPQHCLVICCAFFLAAMAVNLLRDVMPASVSRFIPIPMAMAVPFYIGAFFGVDMLIGTVILFVWQKLNGRDADDYAVAVASGLICGDGIWSIPSAVLSILRINPPLCMAFRPSSAFSR
ncbi:hypothetical protein ZWY2020_056962 [Hordeum vulgare]|nr:hypothetical protein ZWY2020_056962 [Hordeum vulgare]